MGTRHSYEDWGAASVQATAPDLLEAYSGVAIVGWYDNVKYRLHRMADEQDANRNDEYAKLLRTFSNTWEENQITGSINRETLEVLRAAAEPLSVMKWSQNSYFRGLVTSLDQLIADQEQLPTGVPTDQNSELTGGAGFSAPPLGNEFGPEGKMPGEEEEKPPGEENPLGGGPEKPEDEIPTR